jgi:hypothetical protein
MKLNTIVMSALLLFSCNSDEKVIDTVLNNTTSGIILKTTQITKGEYDNTSPSTANFSSIVEIRDAQNGGSASSIKVYAKYTDNNGGTNTKAETLVKTISSAQFTAGPYGNKAATITVTLAELKTALSLTDAQVRTCDVATIRLEAVAIDGRVFTNSNASGTITGGSFFASPFLYSANVVGGALPDNLEGTHTFSTTGMYIPGVPSCGGDVTGTITWGATTTPGEYTTTDMSFGLFESTCWSDTPAVSGNSKIKWFCKTLTSLGVDQYSSTWTYTIKSVVGPILKLEFKSSFQTGEGGIVTITRQGNANWPVIMQD